MIVSPTDEQEELVEDMTKWFRNPCKIKMYYSYSGAAGTGKTTTLEMFMDKVGLTKAQISAAAYVGKAVLVLLRHGLPASTIHSLIYHTVVEYDKVDSDDDDEKHFKARLRFILRKELDKPVSLIIIDEATMVNDYIRDQILSFGIPVIFLGDNNQLPPITGISSVMLHPDFTLTKIMRQAEDDPIVFISQCILKGIDVDYGTYGLSSVVDSMKIDSHIVTDYDIIICAKNKTRERLNNEIRTNVLHYGDDPVIGDKIICRQNNWDRCVDGIYLTNGLLGYITDISRSRRAKGYLTIDFRPDFMQDIFEDLRLDYTYLKLPQIDKASYGMSNYDKFEYGYVITAHLSQGSEYENVMFIDEPFHDADTTKKLRYTAVTRARTSITIVKAYKQWGYRKMPMVARN